MLVGVIAALIFAAAAFAQLPVGRLLDRWGARPLLFAIEGIKAPLLLAMALAPGGGSAALALPVMLLVFGEIPITAWLLGRHLGERWWSRAYSVQYLLSLGVAAGTVPLITALYRQTGDQTALFVVLAACSATILASTFLVPARDRCPLANPPAPPQLMQAEVTKPRGAPTMDGNERQVIDELFGKLRQLDQQAPQRDAEAEAHIRQQVAAMPTAPYYMAQAILVQEQALANLQNRVQELERAATERPAAGGFLGGLFGGGQPAAARRGMVPVAQGPIPPAIHAAGRARRARPGAGRPAVASSLARCRRRSAWPAA